MHAVENWERSPRLFDTRDGQLVFVGRECFKLIKQAGEHGYQPPQGGPRLYVYTGPPIEAQG